MDHHFAYDIFSLSFLYEIFLFVSHWNVSKGLSWEYGSISSISLTSVGLVYEHVYASVVEKSRKILSAVLN